MKKRELTRLPEEKTVLIVETNPMARHFYAIALTRAGFGTIEAGDADEAEQILSAGYHIDVLMMDYAMPKLNGQHLAAWIREHVPEIAVIVMVGEKELAGSGDLFPAPVVVRPKTWHPQELADMVSNMPAGAAA